LIGSPTGGASPQAIAVTNTAPQAQTVPPVSAENPDNGQQQTYHVVRPGNMGSAAIPGMENMGPWIAQERGQIIMFVIQGGNAVTGNAVPAAMAPAFRPRSK
jgi:hypothetical protein